MAIRHDRCRSNLPGRQRLGGSVPCGDATANRLKDLAIEREFWLNLIGCSACLLALHKNSEIGVKIDGRKFRRQLIGVKCNSMINGPNPPPQQLLIREKDCNPGSKRYLSSYLRISSSARLPSTTNVPMAPRPPPPPPPRPPWPTPPPSPGQRPCLLNFQTSCRPITPSARTHTNRICKTSNYLRFKPVASHVHARSLSKCTSLRFERRHERKDLETMRAQDSIGNRVHGMA